MASYARGPRRALSSIIFLQSPGAEETTGALRMRGLSRVYARAQQLLWRAELVALSSAN